MGADQDQVSTILKLADRELGLKNYAAADLLCHEVLARKPGQYRALKYLARARKELGIVDEPHAAGEGARYLLIKPWGYGFWSDMTHVLGCLLLAEITGRTPVVYWGAGSLFHAGTGDAFTRFWEPVSASTPEDVKAAMAGGVYPGKWSEANIEEAEIDKWHGPGSRLGAINFLCRAEPVAVSDFFINPIDVAVWAPPNHFLHGKGSQDVFPYLAERYLKPCAEVQDRVAAFRAQHLTSGEVLAVHLRGSDKSTEFARNDASNKRCIELLDAEPSATRFFVLTDDERWLEYLTGRYGSRVIYTACQRTSTLTGTHYLADVDRTALGHEAMIDTYLALGCDRFLGNGRSTLSNIIVLLKSWPPGACRVIEPLLLGWRNIGIHMSDDGASWNALTL